MDRCIGLQPGVNVDIQRTDGRVHTAVISGVNNDTSSVTVEWFERGETKGKEIELEVLYRLNPELKAAAEIQNILPSKLKRFSEALELRARANTLCTTAANPVRPSARVSAQRRASSGMMYANTSSSVTRYGGMGYVSPSGRAGVSPIFVVPDVSQTVRRDSNSDEGEDLVVPTTSVSASLRSRTQQRRNGTNISNVLASVKGSPSYVGKQTAVGARVPAADEVKGQTTRAARTTRQTNGKSETVSQAQVVTAIPTAVPAIESYACDQVMTSRQTFSQQPIQPAGIVALANGKQQPRRSNVVKEVERLKKNREERRLKQAEMKESKEAMMNMDPGNPNWEFMGFIRDYTSGIEFRPLRPTDAVETHQITVCVRKRPLSKKEVGRKEVDVITVPTKDQMVVHEPKHKVDLTKYLENHLFRYDYAFDETSSNETVYRFTAQPLVQTIFEGGMATCFAYGQTGSGKTHTMGGDFHGRTQDCKKGIYAMAANDVFKLHHSAKYRNINLRVSASFFEIYSGKVFDLLANKAKLRVLEDGKQEMQIVGLTERVVTSVEDVLKLIQHGNNARTSGQTSANSNSSRSHAVFQILLRPADHTNRLHGKFSLIDLAGNERGADTSSANRQTRMEGAEINKSLLALKECIRALGKKGAHLPFRASKLTLVLRDSFIGEKSRTCMIAMISPGMSSCEHSLNTLRYADRVKELAVNDPLENKMSPTARASGASDDDEEEDDLRQLRSLNEHELSADLITFHQAVSQLQVMEDDLLENHKIVLDDSERWMDQDRRLLDYTAQVDYDQDEYSQQLQDLLNTKIAAMSQLRDKVDAFRGQLVAEEQISQRMVRPNWSNHN